MPARGAKLFDAGFDRQKSLDVIACIAVKVMTNYTNGLAHTPLDRPMVPFSDGIDFGH